MTRNAIVPITRRAVVHASRAIVAQRFVQPASPCRAHKSEVPQERRR
jgi:hypothetical protein